ncbi:MAG TPA: ImmA/IrrE family metallo-endopeptidase [Solirubrobacteraceae bacterium]|nr:ImmA/IrrE family metallo-endopeptidase [Solirubrobacteraceae bacterium]
MASRTLAYVTPTVLLWARESAGYSVEDAAIAIDLTWSQLETVEQGYDLLTLRQAERLATLYGRPLATLFLSEPPAEEPLDTQFRRLPGAPAPPWPAAMRLLARRIRGRQDAAIELYDALDEEPPWTSHAKHFVARDRASLPRVAREVLGIGRDEQSGWSEKYAPLRAWTDAVEGQGILVMQDGTMPVEEMRGFASMDAAVPVVVANTKDDPRARSFTIIHEFGHLVLVANGIPPDRHTERWCNEFAGEVLMPSNWLAEAFEESVAPSLLGRTEQVARTFSVTPLAAAFRLRITGTVPERESDEVINEIRSRGRTTVRAGGGDYYLNQIAGLGPRFIQLVFSALDGQTVTYPVASTLLAGVKVNHFEQLRDKLGHRA